MTIKWDGPIWFVKTDGNSQITEKSGIYFITEKIGTMKCTRYIGQSDNISYRIRMHRLDSEPNEKLRKLFQEKMYDGIYIYTTEIHDQTRMNNLEHTAVMDFGGIEKLFNEKVPEGRYLENINYPADIT